MKTLLILVVTGSAFLTGCASVSEPEAQRAVQVAQSEKIEVPLEQVNCLAMPVSGDKQDFSVNLPFNNQYLALPSGETPFVAYQLPQGNVTVTIDSLVQPASGKQSAQVLAPAAALLNSDNQIIKTLDTQNVEYVKPGFLTSESLSLKVNTANSDASCLLVYTTDQQRSSRTKLMNEAKEYARVHGVVAPPVADTFARHGDIGELKISVKQQAVAQAPIRVNTSTNTVPVTDSFRRPMTRHYVDGVQGALKNKQLDKAIELRTELKQVIKATDQYFSSQYGKAASKIIMPTKPMEQEGFAGKAMYHYQTEVGRYLKLGQASSALKQMDNLKGFQESVDQLFNH